MKRSAGILLPVFSLPGPYGIGTLGKEARAFADFLKAAGQRWWQILPVGPTGAGDSPYTSVSTFAGNPLLLDPEALAGAGEGLMVTPRDIDQRVADLVKVIGYGINLALQPGLTIEDVDLFLS